MSRTGSSILEAATRLPDFRGRFGTLYTYSSAEDGGTVSHQYDGFTIFHVKEMSSGYTRLYFDAASRRRI